MKISSNFAIGLLTILSSVHLSHDARAQEDSVPLPGCEALGVDDETIGLVRMGRNRANRTKVPLQRAVQNRNALITACAAGNLPDGKVLAQYQENFLTINSIWIGSTGKVTVEMLERLAIEKNHQECASQTRQFIDSTNRTHKALEEDLKRLSEKGCSTDR